MCTCTQKLCVFIFKFIFKLSLQNSCFSYFDKCSTQGARHAVFGISLSVFLSVSVSETIINFQWTGAQLQFDDDCLFLVVLPGGRVLYAMSQDTGVYRQIYTFFTCQVCYKREKGAINKVLFIKSLEFCTEIHNLKPTRIETKIHVGRILEGSG